MFSRRYLRIKVVQSLYAYKQESYTELPELEQYLFKNLDHTYSLYVYLNKVVREVLDYSSTDVALAQKKYIKSDEDSLATEAWLDFRYIQGLGHYDFHKFFRKTKLSIQMDEDLVKRLYKTFKADPEFKRIIQEGFDDAKKETYALQYLLADIIMNHEDFDNFMEEHWLNWQDEKEFAMNAVLKTMKACKTSERSPIFEPAYKGVEDDHRFVKALLKSAVYEHDEVMSLIAEHAKNWDLDRITLLDKVILLTAITEMRHSEVPLRVSLDEYIEIAKLYSTPKSKDFINGVLDKVMREIMKSSTKV